MHVKFYRELTEQEPNKIKTHVSLTAVRERVKKLIDSKIDRILNCFAILLNSYNVYIIIIGMSSLMAKYSIGILGLVGNSITIIILSK
jgi:hypothetical protein